VVATREDRSVVRLESARVPGGRVCVLFEWVGGQLMPNAMTLAREREFGQVAALLHEHGAATPSRRDAERLADRVLY
jgi:Ser/Thr protein kinase RdoA (MazF antagonist)